MELHLPVVIGLMVAALVLAIGAKRAHVPYNVALVVGGMLITLSHVLPEAPHLEPEVVFLVCLPAILLGCILAVTDTVSILFAFRRAPVPGRLSAIVLGESLFNDGTALVAYAAISSIVVAGSTV